MSLVYLNPEINQTNIDFSSLNLAKNWENADICVEKDNDGQLILSYDDLSLCLDLTAGNYRHRTQHSGKEPLLNALKIKGKLPHRVLDATPGVLKDAWLMAGKGIEVIACERHPIIALLQYHALAHAQANHDCARIAENIQWQFADATSLLTADYLDTQGIDSIYLDPMYPHSPNSAAVKKDLTLLQHIVGDDADSATLLEAALTACQQATKSVRIVVKRPPHAKPLANRPPSYESKTGKTRFDVYV